MGGDMITQVNLSSFDYLTSDLGLTVTTAPNAPIQPAGFPHPIVFFPVTAFDPDQQQVFHDGSSLTLSAGGSFVEFADFIVDLDALEILADVTYTGGSTDEAVVFLLEDCTTMGACVGLDGSITSYGLELSLSGNAAGVIESVLGVEEDLEGAPIGVANMAFLPSAKPRDMAVAGLISASTSSFFSMVSATVLMTYCGSPM